MKRFQALICMLLALALSACSAPATHGSEDPSVPAAPSAYTVSVSSAGGMPLADIEVFVYADDTCGELVDFGKTDEAGSVSLELPESAEYAIVLESVPAGYQKEALYHFEGRAARIQLSSRLIEDESLSAVNLGLGDVMVDFEVTAADGSTVRLSQMLAEKKMVLLNFFFTTCGPCASEFPYMQQAYESYASDVGIIALDPLDESGTVATYQASMGLTFPMAACPAAWSQTFNLSGYPTSVVIDRYGVICLIEVGGITSLRPFEAIFSHFTADDYTQKLYGSVSELVTTVKPSFQMASTDEISRILNCNPQEIIFRPETGESAEYTWPFIEAEKNGEVCLKASNQSIENSYAILYADVHLETGEAIAFDYLASSEKGCDILYVIVDGQDVFAISGWDEEETWQSCYAWVAQESRQHELALCYLKDSDTNEADDTVYLKNMRIVNADQIDTPTYIPQPAALTQDSFYYQYARIILNETDGYYHVGSKDGPLLLANMMDYSDFSEEQTLWDIVYNSDVTVGGVSLYDAMVDYFSYASNSALYGYCTVNQELVDFLTIVDEHFGFDDADRDEWLKLCIYYAPYGTESQLTDPIAGLATFSALEAKLGVGIESNCFTYDRPIMPRGLLAAFTPTTSGVYKITSHANSDNGVDAWIFGEDRAASYTYSADQRMQPDALNCYMYYYMEAGKTYYIDIAFWDIYEVGTIPYDITYVASSYKLFRLAAPGFFTYDPGATGEDMYHLVSGGIDVVLGADGFYREDLGDGETGSILYCDFTGSTGVFSDPLASVQVYDENGDPLYDEAGEPVMRKGLIEKGAFDFSKTEYDQFVLTVLEQNGGDAEKADAYLRSYWGEDYETLAAEYQIRDVFAGRYHGKGEDYTEAISKYLSKIVRSSPTEQVGCVPVTEELAQLLQMLMDKFTFSDVENSWTKLCYYYDYLGPEN